MSKVWDEIKKWGKSLADAALDFFTFGTVSQAAQSRRSDDYEKARNKAKGILNQLDSTQVNLNQLKDALVNRKTDLLNVVMNSSPFGKQYEDLKRSVKQIDKKIGTANEITRSINNVYQGVNSKLDNINNMQTESGLINQLSNKVPDLTYDSAYAEQLSDMAKRIN